MSTNSRVAWVDIAKSFAIILVALNHAAVLGVPEEVANPSWLDVNAHLAAFRMPMFFFAAGLFAESIARRPWKRLWYSRLALLVWMFLLWTLVRFAYFSLVPMDSRPRETSVLVLAITPLWPLSGLWFLHALAAFFIVSKLLHRVPPRVMLALAAIGSIAFSSGLTVYNISYDGMAKYYVFFLLGLYFREAVLRANTSARPLVTVGAILAYGLAVAGVAFLGIEKLPGVQLVLGIAAITAGSLLARTIAATPARALFEYLGRNTIQIYVLHVLLIALIYTLLTSNGATATTGAPSWLLPLGAAAIAIAASLGIAAVAKRTPVLRYGFQPPRWFSCAPRALPTQKNPPTPSDGHGGIRSGSGPM